jgi:hypothetical protein
MERAGLLLADVELEHEDAIGALEADD